MMSVPGSNPRRWGFYVRISGDSGERGDEDYISLETEEAGCRELIGATGGLVDERHVYREVWTGVELFQRPVLIRLRETIRRGELDAVAVYQPKRWSRDPDHAAYLKTELRHHGAEVRFVLDDRGDSEGGQLLSYLDHWVGKKEHQDILERTMRARVALVKGGRAWVGPNPPSGLRWTFRQIERRDGLPVAKHDR
jgi:site-specific DNA recombinase